MFPTSSHLNTHWEHVAGPPLLTSGCSSCRGRRGTAWPGLCCCLVWTSRCVCWPGCAARPGCWWCKPEPARGRRCSGAGGSETKEKERERERGRGSNKITQVHFSVSLESPGWFQSWVLTLGNLQQPHQFIHVKKALVVLQFNHFSLFLFICSISAYRLSGLFTTG